MFEKISDLWKTASDRVKTGVARFLNNNHNHFSCFLPSPIGRLPAAVIHLFFSGIAFSPVQLREIKQLPDDAVIIYINKFKSKFEYLFYHDRYQREHLPVPQLAFEYRIFMWQPVLRVLRILVSHLDFLLRNKRLPDPYTNGYIRDELLNNSAGFLSLVEKRGFYRRFVKDKTDPLAHFIEMQEQMDRPIYLVPQLMFFSKKPQRTSQKLRNILFRSEIQPGILRKIIILFRNPEKIFVDVSEPLNLKAYLGRPENQNTTKPHLALMLRRDLLLQINRHRQTITGPVLKSRQELKETILTDETLQEYMAQYADKKGIPIYQVRKEADGYLDEIAANYNMLTVNLMKKIIEWLSRLMFDGVSFNEEVLNRVKFMSFRGPLVFVPCHKSHIDYLIISYILFVNNMQVPHIAAGQNLSFWPLGPIFRGGGAFFIRRTFRGAVLYSKIFSEYVFNMLKEGFNIEFFIEGGRSRTGKLLPPKLGFLNILLNAFKNGACDDLIFVPVYIGYDRVIEENSYLHELEGGQKQSEDLSQLVKARKFLKKRYGKIYIEFNDPMPLSEQLGEDNFKFDNMNQKEQNVFCRELAHKILHRIDQKTVVTPHALVASAILNRNGQRFSLSSVNKQIRTYTNYLDTLNVKLSDTLLIDADHAVDAVIEDYEQGKLIELISRDQTETQEGSTYFAINENKRPSLEYYKNNCVNFFVPAAFTAMAILTRDSFQFAASEILEDYGFLEKLFKLEFSQDPEATPEYHIKRNIKAFINEAALVPHPTLQDTYNITSAGYRTLKTFAMFLASFLESYLVVLQYFKNNPENHKEPKERLKKIHSLAEHLYKDKFIDRKEALSKINFINAVDTFTSNGFLKGKGDQTLENHMQRIRTLLNNLKN